MLIVSDTSVLIALSSIGRLEILKAIFNEVIIPEGVSIELIAEDHSFKFEEWMKVQKITNTDLFDSFYLNLDKGESEAITLSIEIHPDYILLDDKEARKSAKSLGLNVIGTVGILVLAKKRGLIPCVMEEIEKLETRINFRLSSELKIQIKDIVNE
jgi:predicted nucleic acid-binding protein